MRRTAPGAAGSADAPRRARRRARAPTSFGTSGLGRQSRPRRLRSQPASVVQHPPSSTPCTSYRTDLAEPVHRRGEAIMSRRLWVVVLMVLAAVGLACQDGSNTAPGGVCVINADNPHRSSTDLHKGKLTIIGKGWFKCTKSPREINIFVEVQRKTVGVWSMVAQERGRFTNPPAGKKSPETVAALPCREGRFRTRARASGIDDVGNRVEQAEWSLSAEVVNPCKRKTQGGTSMDNELWRELVNRLSNEATRRGGTAIEDIDMLTLQPPQDSGETVRTTLYHDESGTDLTVIVTTGFAYQLAASLNDPDDVDYVGMTVVAILDGRATEVVEIAKDGTWLNVVSTVETPDGGARQSTQVAPAFHLAGAPVDHEHVRRIDPWPRLADAETFPEA